MSRPRFKNWLVYYTNQNYEAYSLSQLIWSSCC